MKYELYKNYCLMILYGLLMYFIGIFINYLELNLYETILFMTLLSFFGFINSHFYMIFDKTHPYFIIKKLIHLSCKNKFLLLINSIPFYKLLILCFNSIY